MCAQFCRVIILSDGYPFARARQHKQAGLPGRRVSDTTS
jgi:hypothetical protein